MMVITGHSFNSEYTRRFHHKKILEGTASDLCRSCKVLDSKDHIIYHCPDFEPWRKILRDEDQHYTIKSLASSEDGQKALIKFLQQRTKFVPHLDRLLIPDFERYIPPISIPQPAPPDPPWPPDG
jgi:hypothetical protein